MDLRKVEHTSSIDMQVLADLKRSFGPTDVSLIKVLTDLRKGEHNGFYRHAGPNGPEERPLAPHRMQAKNLPNPENLENLENPARKSCLLILLILLKKSSIKAPDEYKHHNPHPAHHSKR